jgi:hypothetical protein
MIISTAFAQAVASRRFMTDHRRRKVGFFFHSAKKF